MIIANEMNMLRYGESLAVASEPGAIIFLKGELGAGKTTLARGFLRGLGFEGRVKSPTYALVESYELKSGSVFHFDLYRIQSPRELDDMGIQDYFLSSSILLIEWPERGEGFLPSPDVICELAIFDNSRDVKSVAHSLRGERMMERF